MKKLYFLAVFCVSTFLSTAANTAFAAVIQVNIVDASNITLTLSGTLIGPEPADGKGILFIDTPVPGTLHSSDNGITGDAMLGSSPLFSAFSGFENSPYSGSLQLRNSSNGIVPLAIGDMLSGSAAISFNNPHGMTQSIFDGIGLPIYWGRNNVPGGPGTFQGYAVTAVPLPAALWLFGTGLLGLIGISRRNKSA